MEFALFLTGCLWTLAARSTAEHAAVGFAVRFGLTDLQPLMSAVFLLFLVLLGYSSIHWIATRNATVRGVNALPARATAFAEWRLGSAIGWGLAIAAILPMVIVGDLHPTFWFQTRALWLTLLSLLSLAALTLAQEAIYRGYLFVRLIRALGPTLATIVLSLVAAVASAMHPHATLISIVGTFFFSVLLSLAYLRTHALWLGWGLHFAWSAAIGILFGMPVTDSNLYASAIDTVTHGALWMTGGLYGPEGAVLTTLAVLLFMIVLYRSTGDLAWEYTHAPIIPGGYPMEAAPPPEHVAMEQAARPAPLVQILSSTPSAASTMPAVEEHLRTQREPGGESGE